MFLDEYDLTAIGGKGGDGCCSFRREKYAPRGGPDGGDGGRGGSVVLRPTIHRNTLYHLGGARTYEAEKGRQGTSSDCTGRGGEDLVLEVPVGTVVYDAERGNLLKDLAEDDLSFVIARGGKGGRGNARFKTATNRVPRTVEQGTHGENRSVRLSLKLIADVGLIGLPNAGKSTLVSTISKARPKIADYPFTTLEPCLGIVVGRDGDSFVMADIPGLIEGAHEGKGLGDKFLRHVERTRVLLHLIDCSDGADPRPGGSVPRDSLGARGLQRRTRGAPEPRRRHQGRGRHEPGSRSRATGVDRRQSAPDLGRDPPRFGHNGRRPDSLRKGLTGAPGHVRWTSDRAGADRFDDMTVKANEPSLKGLLSIMQKEGASDLILKAGGCPGMRVAGAIRFIGDQPLSHDLLVGYLEQVLDRAGLEEFRRVGASDQALSIPEVGRFRCNAFHQCGDIGMVFRSVKSEIPSFKDLALPADPLKRLAQRKRGLVLATGVAGAGKSTTLGAMIEHINRNAYKHIITIEDPIEFLFEDRCSIVNQREIGTDAPSFPEAMRSAVRQSPDVILIGEMRDRGDRRGGDLGRRDRPPGVLDACTR